MALTFEITVGMFMEFVAKPMPNVIAASTPRNSATSDSRRCWISRQPGKVAKFLHHSAFAITALTMLPVDLNSQIYSMQPSSLVSFHLNSWFSVLDDTYCCCCCCCCYNYYYFATTFGFCLIGILLCSHTSLPETTRKPSYRWQTRATLAKSLHGLRKSSGL